MINSRTLALVAFAIALVADSAAGWSQSIDPLRPFPSPSPGPIGGGVKPPSGGGGGGIMGDTLENSIKRDAEKQMDQGQKDLVRPNEKVPGASPAPKLYGF